MRINSHSHSLMSSGYSEKYRLEVISAAVTGFERQCARADLGGTPLHRPRHYDYENRRRKKLITKTSWYRPHNAVGFFPPTPDANLLKRIQAIVTRNVSKLGLSVKCIKTLVNVSSVRRKTGWPNILGKQVLGDTVEWKNTNNKLRVKI